MPFAVFRQHQRKLLAVFAILAMIGFVLSDTLPRWMNSGGLSDKDMVVAELYGKKIHRSDLLRMNEKRQRANRFMYYMGAGTAGYFGGSSTTELIDALILDHEANRLNIPDTPAFARDWIDQQTNGAMTPAIFEGILARFERSPGGVQLLSDIASQVRMSLTRQQLAVPIVTPLDVYRNFRDQTERTSFKVVPFAVDSFAGKVVDPTETEVKEFFDKYKDTLPNPVSPNPGFKVPRQVKAESLSIDANAVTKRVQAKITEDELKTYYEARKKEFPMDGVGGELPIDLFKDAPELTPPRYLPLSEIRDTLSNALARDKANEEIQDTFEKIREQFLDKFSEQYDQVQEKIDDAKKDGYSTEGLVPPPLNDLAGVAKQYDLTHQITPMIDREAAGKLGTISDAKAGSGISSDPRTFAVVLFEAKTRLYEAFELTDSLGRRYLIRKIADIPAHVVPLEEIREEVVRAWKREKARPIAQKAADELAARLKAGGGQIKELSIDNRPVITIDSVTKLKQGPMIPSQVNGQFRFDYGPATPTDLNEITMAGQPLVDTLFGLKPGEVAVEPDLPKQNYYVMVLEKRDPVPFMALMGPRGSLSEFKRQTQEEMFRRAYTDGMAYLRDRAGYRPQDYPTEAQDREADREG